MRGLNSILVFFVFIVSISFTEAQNLSANTTGSFTFNPSGPLNNQLVEVYYHIPNGDLSSMPIVFSFHGGSRNGSDYRDYWINMANANNFMVFAPEFSSMHYPGLGDNYLMANIFDDGDNPSPSSFNNANEWTFSVLDPIFNQIKADINSSQQAYNAWGHSGGAQFLHRFVLYMPNSLLNVAVCSNAGWYTVPENSVSFPYGIQNGQLPNNNLTAAFSKKLIVHLGQNDNDPNSAGLRHNSIVDNQQGLHRLKRGQYFFNTSQTKAQSQSVNFNWEKHEVPNIGHDPQQMANDALPYVLMSNLSSADYENKKQIFIYPNPAKDYLYFGPINSTVSDLILYNVYGQQIKIVKIKNSGNDEKFDISDLSPGLYMVKAGETTKKFLKE